MGVESTQESPWRAFLGWPRQSEEPGGVWAQGAPRDTRRDSRAERGSLLPLELNACLPGCVWNATRPQVAPSARRPLPSRPPSRHRPPGGRAGGARHVGGAGRTRRPIARCDAPPEAGRALKMAAGAPSGSARQ